MLQTRVIPCLLLRNGGLVKTVKFKEPRYVGDPINAVKIFNDKEVHELVLLDIEASKNKRGPQFDYLSRITREAFMPMGYGGGVRNLDDIQRLLGIGFEKVIINTATLENPDFVRQAAESCGSQSVVASVDVKKTLFGGYQVASHSGRSVPIADPAAWAAHLQGLGAGEILLNSVDRDGTFTGYDVPLIRKVASAVNVPVVAIGGAGSVQDFGVAIKQGGAAAVSAGSLFVFHGPHKAVLITYPTQEDLRSVFH
jgi:imidazole glycerol-phosphate synthase subunit HisF